jgi:uncharacterized membrane protein YfcA
MLGFVAVQAVIVNKAMSLSVVLTARQRGCSPSTWTNCLRTGTWWRKLLAGSLIGAWAGATWATKMRSATPYEVLAALLVLIAAALAWNHVGEVQSLDPASAPRVALGIPCGCRDRRRRSLMGVAGEVLIPTTVLLIGLDVKIAGSLSLAVSLPTMLVAFARYNRDNRFQALRTSTSLVLAMAAGSIAGTFAGGLLLGVVSETLLVPLLVALLLWSSINVWRQRRPG